MVSFQRHKERTIRAIRGGIEFRHTFERVRRYIETSFAVQITRLEFGRARNRGRV